MALRDRGLAAPAVALAAFVGLTVVHTWPLATGLATLARHDNADTLLNEWIIAWVGHALRTNPLGLFDANIYYPERDTLAFSEHLFLQGTMVAPLAWLGAPLPLLHNVVQLTGFVLTGWVTALVVARWTDDWYAGVLAGSVAAFNTHFMSRMPQVQTMHVEFLPLALAALDRVLAQPRLRDAIRLGLWTALQMMCSGYLLALTAVSLVAAALSRLTEWLGPSRWRRSLACLFIAATLSVAIVLPFLLPYARARRDQGLVRSIDAVELYSASPVDYVTTVANLHYQWWSHRFYDSNDTLFPGVVPLLLTLAAIVTGVAWRDRRARMLLAAGAVCCILSFGPKLPTYVFLYNTLPVLEGLRGAARFGYITIFAVGCLGGFGLAWLRQWLAARRVAPAATVAVGVAAILIVNLEGWTGPHEMTPLTPPPLVYRALARQSGAIVELPMHSPGDMWPDARYLVNSVRHWRPMLNGYSGFVPASYSRHYQAMLDFPSASSIDYLRQVGVTDVVLHTDELPDLESVLDRSSALQETARSRDIVIYRLLSR